MSILARTGLCRLTPGHSCRALSVFLDQTANRIRRLCATRQPMFHPIEFQRAVVPGLLWIICADDFNEFAVARVAAVGHDDLVIGPI